MTEKDIINSGIKTFREGNIDGAELIFRNFIKDYPESDLADNACYNLAKIALKKDDIVGALQWYEYLMEVYPDSDAAYFGKDEYAELLHSIGQGKEIADECYYKGCKLLKDNKLIEAEREFDRLIKEYPDCEYVVLFVKKEAIWKA